MQPNPFSLTQAAENISYKLTAGEKKLPICSAVIV